MTVQPNSDSSGSGIFVQAGLMFSQTESTGVTLMLWVAGAFYAISGVILYIELGLAIPRRRIPIQKDDGTIQERIMGVPRSGAEIHYVSNNFTNLQNTSMINRSSCNTYTESLHIVRTRSNTSAFSLESLSFSLEQWLETPSISASGF
jgi:hypothetical protein